MKNGFLIATLALSLTGSSLFACDINGKTGFAPANNLKISKFDKDTNGMTEQTFLAIVKRVSDLYAPIVASKGATLEMDNNWNDETVNAFANRTGSIWHVNMFGGLARHPLTTNDGFMMVVCHETGHHLGGAPKKHALGGTWAANEGQADYFAATKCMRRVLEKDDNQSIVAKMKIDAEVTNKCQLVYKNADEIALCQRVAMAGKSLGSLLAALGKTPAVSFTTPNKTVVTKTFDDHPEAQCRLDTYFAGTLCDKSLTEDFSDKSPIPGACIKKDGFKFGPRPLCWYKPTAAEI